MSDIKYLKDENGNKISPITNIKSIFNDNGVGLLDIFYPVGSYYETSNTNFNPNISWGGTWVQDTEGLCTVGANISEDPTLNTSNNRVGIEVSAIIGEKNHTITRDELPNYSLSLGAVVWAGGHNGNIGFANSQNTYAQNAWKGEQEILLGGRRYRSQ